MEKIRFECLNCDARLAVPAAAAGKQLKCPKCGARVEVEAPAPADPDGLDLKDPTPPPPSAAEAPPDILRGHRAAERRAPSKSFVHSLDSVPLYPFSSFGSIFFLVLMIPFWAFLREIRIPFGFILQWIVGGYIATYMFNVLYETSMGKDRAPGGPPLTAFGELIAQFFRFFGATFVAFAPVIAFVIAAAALKWVDLKEGDIPPAFWIGLGATGVFGVVYYPMALMLIGFSESWIMGFNYLFGVKSLFRIKGDYLICALFFVATFAAAFLLEVFWVAAAGEAIAARIFAAGVTTAVELYLYAIQMRALGLLYITNKERLAWFR